jgi:hypothetical protein
MKAVRSIYASASDLQPRVCWAYRLGGKRGEALA